MECDVRRSIVGGEALEKPVEPVPAADVGDAEEMEVVVVLWSLPLGTDWTAKPFPIVRRGFRSPERETSYWVISSVTPMMASECFLNNLPKK